MVATYIFSKDFRKILSYFLFCAFSRNKEFHGRGLHGSMREGGGVSDGGASCGVWEGGIVFDGGFSLLVITGWRGASPHHPLWEILIT